MLVVVQFPIADLRSFVPVEDRRVQVAAQLAYDTFEPEDSTLPEARRPGPFIRNMGPLRKRHQGIRIAGEARYFRGCHALRLDDGLHELPDPRGGTSVPVRLLFRRFQPYAGPSEAEAHRLAKFEMAFELQVARPGQPALNSEQLHQLIDRCLALPVVVPQYADPAQRVSTTLLRAGALIANQLRWTTTAKPSEPDALPEPWAISARMPALLIEYGTEELSGAPAGAAAVAFANAPQLKFHGRERSVDGTATQCWYLGTGVARVEKLPDAVDIAADAPQETRNARIAVLRQHAEREVLAYVLTCLSHAGRLKIHGLHPAHAALREYLVRSAALTKRRSRQSRQLPILGDVDRLDPAAIVVDEANPARYQRVCERLSQVLDPVLMSDLFAAIRHLPMAEMDENIEISKLLQAHRPRPLKVAVSYSHADDRLLQSFAEHAEADALSGVIESWTDHAIPGGSDWAAEIDSHFAQADVVVLLLSPGFLASRYCMEIEVPLALQRRSADQAVVLPVLAVPCQWQGTAVAALQVVQPYGKAVLACGSRADAWRCVRHEMYTAAAALFRTGG